MKRNITITLLCLIIAMILMSGCSSNTVNSLKYELKLSTTPSGVAAENSGFKLIYNAEKACVTLYDKNTGESFGTTPAELQTAKLDEYGMPIKNPPKLESPIIIEYVSPETNVISTATSYTDSISKKNVSSRKIENGIEVTYYFESAKISVPVKYTLSDDGLELSIEPEKIQEEDYLIYQISVAPFLCSLKNTSASGYMFVPSGSGALIYPEDSDSNTGKNYTADVYGRDPQIKNKYQTEFTLENPCRLPVFGVAEDNTAVFAVIKNGAESTLISAQTGVKNLGFSSVYAVWRLRSYQNIIHRLGISIPTEKQLYSAKRVTEQLTVSYSPLYGADASYTGMAEKYRDYLFGQDTKTVTDDLFSLKVIGGVETEKDFLGIPYKTLLPTTDFKQAYSIIDEINSELKEPFNVNLIGYGNSGISAGKVAGGYKFSSRFGKLSDLKLINGLMKDIGGTLYMDFDVLTHSAGSLGTKAFDASRNPVKLTGLNIWSRMEDESGESVYYNRRNMIKKISDKASEKVKAWGLDGISLFNLSNTAYSDYNDDYFVKAGASGDYSAISSSISKKGLRTAVSNANAYAALTADIIYDTPVYSDLNDLFYTDIPFYQIVFKGKTKCLTPSVNTASDEKKMLLKAAESGIGLSYTLYGEFDKKLIRLPETDFYGSEYASLKSKMLSQIREYKGYFDRVSDTQIKEHIILNRNVRKTVFENGIEVYVNYGTEAYESPLGLINSMEYKFSGEGLE